MNHQKVYETVQGMLDDYPLSRGLIIKVVNYCATQVDTNYSNQYFLCRTWDGDSKLKMRDGKLGCNIAHDIRGTIDNMEFIEAANYWCHSLIASTLHAKPDSRDKIIDILSTEVPKLILVLSL